MGRIVVSIVDRILLTSTLRSVFVLIIFFVLFTSISALQESLTFDEIVYLQEGRKNLITREFTEPYGPPLIKEIAVLPLVFSFDRYIPSQYPSLRVFPARMMIVFLAVGLLCSAYKFVATEFGTSVGIVSLFFLAFDPSILAHSHYVTLDMGIATFIWLSFVAGVRVWRHPSLRNYLILGLFVGLAVSSKLTAWPLLFGLFIVTLLNCYIVRDQRIWRIINAKALFTLGLVILIVWGSYGFGKELVVESRDDGDRVSVKVKEWARKNGLSVIANAVNYLETRPVPLGGYFAIVKNSVIRNQQVIVKEPKMLFVNWVFKSPLPYLFLIAFGGRVIWRIRRGRMLTAFVGLSFLLISLSGLPPLIRHLLPLMPFMGILAGYGFVSLVRRGRRVLAAVLVVWQAISVMLSSPYYITYANELMYSPELKINRLNDSNLDWGQGLIVFKKYLVDKKVDRVNFSYFGRDDGGAYGLTSPERWGGYKVEEICRFHKIDTNFIDFIRPGLAGLPRRLAGARPGFEYTNEVTAISVTNWQMCGYKEDPNYVWSKVKEIVGGSILIF